MKIERQTSILHPPVCIVEFFYLHVCIQKCYHLLACLLSCLIYSQAQAQAQILALQYPLNRALVTPCWVHLVSGPGGSQGANSWDTTYTRLSFTKGNHLNDRHHFLLKTKCN